MNKAKFLIALLTASASVAPSMAMIKSPENTGGADVLAIPGAIIATVVSGNVHAFSTWVLVLGNFTFYFGAVYLVSAILEYCTRSQSPPTEK